MAKVFNTTAVCVPEEHYMVNLEKRLCEIKKLVDRGDYFIINRARQYGKTTTLIALSHFLQKDYYVVRMDFQTFGSAEFRSEQTFASAFASSFLELLEYNDLTENEKLSEKTGSLLQEAESERLSLRLLFKGLREICGASDRPIVLMIDEVDNAANNQIFLDFLAQLRAQYISRYQFPALKSVILAGVYDVKNLKLKIRTEEEHKYNSPWNIAADFKIDMSFSKNEIAGMLDEYERDYQTGMDLGQMAGWIWDYTAGYPFLVSRICQLIDEDIWLQEVYGSKAAAWTRKGFQEAVRILLAEKNTLFESLSEKLERYPGLNDMLKSLLFTGKTIPYNYYEPSISIATMFGFVKNQEGVLTVANRIFETWLYNFYLSAEQVQKEELYTAAIQDKNQFLVQGHLNMRRVLERFVDHFHEIYGSYSEKFVEEEGRRYFLLYLRPIINGTGNYYVEARTRDLRRTDLIVDYRGEQYIIEMKIWRGQEYLDRGEQQLAAYLDDYHASKGYLLSFNFNQRKKTGVHEITVGDKTIIEAVV